MKFSVKKFASEFKEFALKANFVDMAVGIIIGMGFNKLIDSFVKDLVMPFFSYFTNLTHFSDWTWTLREQVLNGEEIVAKAVVVRYGKFIEIGVDFFIIALVTYIVVKGYNIYKKRHEDPDDNRESTPKSIELLNSINKNLESLNDKFSSSK